MATRYIDPSATVNGDGTLLNPFNSWSAVTWVSGDTYLQKAGTVAHEQVSVGISGTASAHVNISRYGSGPNPIVGMGALHGIYLAARQYITIDSIDAEGCTGQGFYIRTSGSNIRTIRVRRCVARKNTRNGFFLDGVVLSATLQDVVFERCEAYDNGEHGFDTLGIVQNVKWRLCKAARNGKLFLGHGFSTHPFISNNITSGWTLVSGNVYSRTLSAGETVQKLINRTSKVTLVKNSGAGSAISTNQWDQSGTTLYINIGGNPNGPNIAWKRAPHGPFYYSRCEAWDNFTDAGPGEGHGFAADDMSGPSFYRSCKAYRNDGAGFQNQWSDDVTMSGLIAYQNRLSNFRTTGHTDRLTVVNCTSVNSREHGFFFDVPFSSVSVNNCLAVNNGRSNAGIFGFAAAATGISASNNAAFSNGLSGTNSTSNITNANGVVTDPQIDDDFRPRASSPLRGSGVFLGRLLDNEGKLFKNPPTIGAREFVEPRNVASQRSELIASRAIREI